MPVAIYAQKKNYDKEIKSLSKEMQRSLDNEDYLETWALSKKILRLKPMHETAGLNAAISASRLNYAHDSLHGLADNLAASPLPDAKYFLARYKHKTKNLDEAIALLNSYLKTQPKQRIANDSDVNYWIACCKNAKEFIAKPHTAVIKNMGPTINSPYDDYVPVIMPDESAMYFTSKRKGSTGNKKNGDNSYFEDIYLSANSESGWKKAENAGFPLNTNSNDACVALSADGHRMIIYRTSPSDPASGDLYITKLGEHGHWETPKLIGTEINSEFIETSACFSNDTSELYFSSNRPEGLGGKDIYRIRHLPNGRWAAPFNLGPNINTPYDDDAPFLHPDGVTLYFSSKGHNSMGEYDVFRSRLTPETNNFSKAENLGYPINDVGNDIFFVVSVDGQRGYYTSNKKETLGGADIYQIDTRFGENDLVVRQCYAYLGSTPARVQITLSDIHTNEIVGTYASNPKTGKFILVLNPLKPYHIMLEEDGYKTIEEDLDPLVKEKDDKPKRYILLKNGPQ